MRNTFVTFAIGDRQFVHRQVNFAVVSLLARAGDADAPAIFVLTDRPEYYRWLRDHLTIVEADPQTLREWRGPYDYFFRIKLRVMQHVAELSPGNLVYLDSDVVCRAALDEFYAGIDAGTPFMHQLEYAMGQKGGKGRTLWKQTAGRKFGPLAAGPGSGMWNSGVVALPAAVSRPWLADALECIDAMCAARIEIAVLEQFSLGLSLDRDRTLQPADRWFIHYWGNKTAWNALIARFLADVQLQQLPIAEVCERFRALPLDIPTIVRRSRAERLLNSLQKRIAPRDQSVLAQLSKELAG